MTLYDQTIPTMLNYLGVMDHLLNKAEAWCKEKGEKEEDLLNARLIEDMKPLPFQVQSISNTAKFVAQRIGDVEPQVWEDNETTFPELHARIAKTVDLLKSLDRKTFEGKDKQEIVMRITYGDFPFETGQKYVSEYAIPNFHFHLSTAYCILRHKGVPVGAMDYLKGVFPSFENKTNST